MVLREYKSKIAYILKHNNGRLIDIAYKANEIIMKSGDMAPELLRYFFEEEYAATEFKKTNEVQIISDNEVDRYVKKYAVEVWSWLNSILKERPSTPKFYKSLYEYISKNKMIRNEKIRAFFLLSIWINPRIPYYKPGKGITIEEKDFLRISKKISKSRAKAKTIVFSAYSTRTEEASVLLELLGELSSQEEKSVLLASIIRNVEIRTENTFLKQKNINENDNN